MSKSEKKPFFNKWCILVIVVLVIGIAIGSQKGKDKDKGNDVSVSSETATDQTDSSGKSDNAESTGGTEDSKVNYDNFLKIQMGQKYEDVVNLIGEGTEKSSSEISGVKTTLYSWDGNAGSNLNVTVQNGIVVGKAQIRLKSVDAGITLEKFNKINNGMTYEQVKEILGEGQIMSQDKIKDNESIMYEYVNSDGSNANFTFIKNSLTLKTQFQLK
ncbi:DUF3862 domain-containing protein [Clostridium cibarium]|uniref:DUF3862 domain-containing protein n=1 Tax=Clostridium cibarium TaxID=2762247 RepID=A0ABR8PY90_9CLOT|nr:DUF3862 domain-containing protein [Clostridium cibarium]